MRLSRYLYTRETLKMHRSDEVMKSPAFHANQFCRFRIHRLRTANHATLRNSQSRSNWNIPQAPLFLHNHTAVTAHTRVDIAHRLSIPASVTIQLTQQNSGSMSEEADLQAKIAALAGNAPRDTRSTRTQLTYHSGRINQQKQSSSHPQHAYGQAPAYQPAPNRWTPYGQYQYSRGGGYHKASYHPAHRNRTLVVNNGTGTPDKTTQTPVAQTPADGSWVSKRDRHMQLINTNVYDQKTQQRQKEIEESARQKQIRRDDKEKNKVIKFMQGKPAYGAAVGAAVPAASREIIIQNLKFRISTDGSKLIRLFGESCTRSDIQGVHFLNHADGSNTDAQSTPKQAVVAGVTFHRSKHGNLYRAGVVKKSQRYRTEIEHIPGQGHQLTPRFIREKTVKSTQLCSRFTSTGTHNSKHLQAGPKLTDSMERRLLMNSVGRPRKHKLTIRIGTCPRGPQCRFTHDASKLAICKDFLRTGTCVVGEEACNFSHDLSPHRVPTCLHFVRGNCTNPECPYAHVNINPAAPTCRAFATMGYCEKGSACPERHVNECPDYADKGICRNKNCRLPHVDTAANQRKAMAAKAGKTGTDGNESSDMSSDEEDYQMIDSDDVDSDDLDEDVAMAGPGEPDHALSQQQDFISFM